MGNSVQYPAKSSAYSGGFREWFMGKLFMGMSVSEY